MPTHSDIVRAFPFPVLEEGNLSFPEGEYAPDIKRNDKDDYSIRIYHKVTMAPLVERLIKDGRAACCCTVSIPITGYRKLFSSGDNFEQEVIWDPDWVGEPPVLCPLIVCNETTNVTLGKEDGVHDLWVGLDVSFRKGAKIAIGPTLRPVSSMQSLLSIDRDESLGSGQLHIQPCPENGFYFSVKVASDLYIFLQNPGGGDHIKHRRSILIHAVSSCFALLNKEYKSENDENGDEGWQSYSNLRALAVEMESKEMTRWSDESFHPEVAATTLFPYLIPGLEEE